jgi:transcriptional regulator with XRE-family HTH domain
VSSTDGRPNVAEELRRRRSVLGWTLEQGAEPAQVSVGMLSLIETGKRRPSLLCTLRRTREELGRWPNAGEWELATNWHVSRRAYARQFGNWRRACRTASRLRP